MFFTRKKPQLQAMASERKVQYATGISRVNITWSRAITGTTLLPQIDISINASTTSSSTSFHHLSNLTDNQHGPFFNFRLSPFLPSQRCGLRRFMLNGRGMTPSRQLKFAWDFTNVQYDASKDVQPVSGYYFCIAVEGKMVLLLGDMEEEGYNHVSALRERVVTIPVSREETVHLRGCIYSTKVFLGGAEKDFAVKFTRSLEYSMMVWIDGRLFKGSREINVSGGVIKIMWDRQEWTDRENTMRCSAAREFATARVAVSYAQVGGGDINRNVQNYFHLNLFSVD